MSPAQDSVAMPEERCDEALDDRAAKPRFEGETVRDARATRQRGNRSLVAPLAHAQHGRFLDESVTDVEFDECEIAPVERKESEEKNPAASQRLPEFDIQVEDTRKATGYRHSSERP